MDLSKPLGVKLKDDDMLDLLERLDVDVIYDFDRTHENMFTRVAACFAA